MAVGIDAGMVGLGEERWSTGDWVDAGGATVSITGLTTGLHPLISRIRIISQINA